MLLNQNTGVDIYFNQCYRRCLSDTQKQIVFFGFRFIVLGIPINIILLQKQSSQLFTIFLIVAFIYNTLCISYFLYFFLNFMKNQQKVLLLAQEHRHTMQIEQQLQEQNLIKNIDFDKCYTTNNMVSRSYYDFQLMERLEDVPQEFKKIRQATGTNLLFVSMETKLICNKQIRAMLGLSAIGLFAFGIVLIFSENLNETQHTILQLFLLSQILFNIKIFAIVVFVAFLPLLIVILIVYFCCCKAKQKDAKLPEKCQATVDIISKCSDCSICFQNILINEEKHTFHQNCIKTWAKVKPTCPICRHLLTGEVEPPS